MGFPAKDLGIFYFYDNSGKSTAKPIDGLSCQRFRYFYDNELDSWYLHRGLEVYLRKVLTRDKSRCVSRGLEYHKKSFQQLTSFFHVQGECKKFSIPLVKFSSQTFYGVPKLEKHTVIREDFHNFFSTDAYVCRHVLCQLKAIQDKKVVHNFERLKKAPFCQLTSRLTPLTSADKKELFLVIQNYALLSYLEWPLVGE